MKTLASDFFERDARIVAKELLGKYLVRRIGRKKVAARITETEAYLGPYDLASHARHGKTARTAVMFGPPGVWYVYFTYGMHYMLNIVARREGIPSAVLIRGVEGIVGPGRLTKKLAIDKTLNMKAAVPASGLWIEDRGEIVPKRKIITGPRVGVDYAGEWAKKPYRYRIGSF